MKGLKIKQKKIAQIDSSLFSTRRRIEASFKDINDWANGLKIKSTSDKINISNFKTDNEGNIQKTLIENNVFKFFSEDSLKPSFLEDIILQLKLIYNIKHDNSKYSAIIYYPIEKKDKFIPEEFVIKPANSDTLSRNVIVIGDKENFTLETCMLTSASCEIMCGNCESFDIPIGIATGLNIKFDNKNNFKIPPKKGFREIKFKKDPSRRFILIIDFYADKNSLLKSIKSETSKLCPNNPIINTITESLGLNDSTEDLKNPFTDINIALNQIPKNEEDDENYIILDNKLEEEMNDIDLALSSIKN